MFGDNESFLLMIVSEADKDGDGEIDFDEFADLMLNRFSLEQSDNRI